jgi:probable addiction module antidote protein
MFPCEDIRTVHACYISENTVGTALSKIQEKGKMRHYRELVTQMIRDPQEAAEYLKASLDEYEQDGNLEAFLLALRSVVEVQGGMTELSRKTALNRQSLYKTLSKQGNPRLHTLHTILHALGFKLTIEPMSPERPVSDTREMPERTGSLAY